MSVEELVLHGDVDEWISGLPEYQQQLIKEIISADSSLETAAQVWISAGTDKNFVPFGTKEGRSIFYEKFLDELHDLLCSSNKYATERSQLAEQGKLGQAAVVAFLTTLVAPALGAAAPIVTPAVALVMVLVTRMGLSAWCAVQTERRSRQG